MASEQTELHEYVEKALVESFSKIFRVNVNTGEFEVYKNDGVLLGDGLDDVPNIYAYIQKLITDEIIYPEYATACRRFTNPEYVRKSVFSGEKRIVQSYKRRTDFGDKWITFAIIAPDGCGPENPTALFTWREADSDAITLLDTLPTISSLYDKLIRINLSNNTFEPVVVDADEQERLVGGVINMYEWWAGYSMNGNIAAEDMGAFSTLTKTGSLQKRFAEDPTPVNFRYRRKVGDEFRWMQLQIAPSVEYSEENQIMLLSLKDVHEEYTAQLRSRQELIDNMSRDALTNLFNRLKFNADIDKLAKSGEPLFTCLYVDVNGLHELNNLLGHQKGDDMLCCVADTLSKHFSDERVYRIGGDEFVVTSIKRSKNEIELAVENVRRDLSRQNYEISVGISTGSCGEDLEKIVAAAELEMRNDKAAYYMRNGDRRRKRQMNEELEQMLVQKQDSERFLNIISRQFSGVYFVDLSRDTLRHIYMPEHFTNLLEESGGCFSVAMRLYVGRFVKPEYHGLFENVLNYDNLDKMLSKSETVQFAYQKIDGVCMNVRILEVDRRPNAKPETIWIFAEETR
ncbi:MAG: GGDEF domain-containing protein [Christensenellaceae bacterium]|nr:GGDEF domain-containing protein [Christensenellaceae bacterium]